MGLFTSLTDIEQQNTSKVIRIGAKYYPTMGIFYSKYDFRMMSTAALEKMQFAFLKRYP